MRTSSTAWDVSSRVSFLAGTGLFRSLPEATLRAIAERMRVRSFPRGGIAFHAGTPAAALHLLASGRVKIVRETEDGREVILRLIGPGEIFGGAGGWGEDVYPASAVIQEDAVVLQLDTREFRALLGGQPDFALAVVRELGMRLREAEARIGELQAERVERRLAHALLRAAEKQGRRDDESTLTVMLTRQDLAELAGSTLSTASRTLSAWEERGLVRAGRERVTILQPLTLAALADDLAGPRGIA